MSQQEFRNRLDRLVNPTRDHYLGSNKAEITLVEYGSYACPHCRAANERIADVRDKMGDRLRYVFRHRPLTNNDLARRAAELVECSRTPEEFWKAHIALMTRSETLTEDDLVAVATDLGLSADDGTSSENRLQKAQKRVDDDTRSAQHSGVMFTPTFFVNNRRYDGPWDENSFADALYGSLGHRVRSAALDFASWAPSTGILLLLATLSAIFLTNSSHGDQFTTFWLQYFGFTFGDTSFKMSLGHWVNDGLLTIFFLVVGLEIKREFTVGHLASRRSAAMPIAGAIGGMAIPALFYIMTIPSGPWAHGWGIPMATDTAFAIALIVMLGKRVPIELRIFLTAAAIVDDIGAIIVVAIFYSGNIQVEYLAAAVAIVCVLAFLNRAGVYRVLPYLILGIALWGCVYAGGLHATLAGVLLAIFIPTRPPANFRALMIQAETILNAEARHEGEVLRHGPSVPTMRAIDDIHDRLESPADRMLRHVEPWSSYAILPLFAFANAGVAITADVIDGHGVLMFAIMAGLIIGKPLGLLATAAIAVKLGLADKPKEYSWAQLAGAGALAGIGFTMSLFIAGQAFPIASDFAAAKIAVFSASVLSAIIGVAILWLASTKADLTEQESH